MFTYLNVKEIKEQLDIVKFLTDYGLTQVVDNGEWVSALCPYHDDHNPSFAMHKGDTAFHCWSCQTKGDAIQLVMDLEGVDFKVAINKLAMAVGYNIGGQTQLDYLRKKWLSKPQQHESVEETLTPNAKLGEINHWAKKFLQSKYPNSKAEAYVRHRKFDDTTALGHELGYYPDDNTFIVESAKQGFSEADLTLAGFFDGGGERFRDRLIFPIMDICGNVVAFSGRSLNDSILPKYTSTPNSEFYKKGFYLYGLSRVIRNQTIVLVEGNFDCIRLQSSDINALAQLGSALTKQQCELLKSLTRRVILLYDGDFAGRNISHSNIRNLIEANLIVFVASLPEGYDPDTFVKDYGISITEDFLSSTVSTEGIEYYYQFHPDKNTNPTKIMVECLESIAKIQEKALQDYYIQATSKVFGLSPESLKSEVKKL